MSNLIEQIRHEQMLLAERMVIRNLEQQGLAKPSAEWPGEYKPLLNRCLSFIETLEACDIEEDDLLGTLMYEIRVALGLLEPLPGGLI